MGLLGGEDEVIYLGTISVTMHDYQSKPSFAVKVTWLNNSYPNVLLFASIERSSSMTDPSETEQSYVYIGDVNGILSLAIATDIEHLICPICRHPFIDPAHTICG